MREKITQEVGGITGGETVVDFGRVVALRVIEDARALGHTA